MNAETPIVTNEDLSLAVRSTAMLADVTIGTWSAERTDASMMDKIKVDAGATGNVGRAIKNMLAGADGELRDAKAAFAAVRSRHYALTLPWVGDPHATRQTGPRLLPNMLFERYLADLATARRAANAALDKFILGYPAAVQVARANLGGLADVTYPSEAEVRAQFRVVQDFWPIPEGTQFKGLPEHFLGKLSGYLEKKQQRMIATAQASMWSEVKERVGHMLGRLSIPLGAPGDTFRVTTVENVRELLTLLPAWNISGAPEVAEIVSEIEEMLHGIDIKDLRKDQIVRNNVAHAAQGIVDKMNKWGL